MFQLARNTTTVMIILLSAGCQNTTLILQEHFKAVCWLILWFCCLLVADNLFMLHQRRPLMHFWYFPFLQWVIHVLVHVKHLLKKVKVSSNSSSLPQKTVLQKCLSVVLPLIQWAHDITLPHHVSHLYKIFLYFSTACLLLLVEADD